MLQLHFLSDRWINEHGELVERYWVGIQKHSEQQPVPLPLCPPKSHMEWPVTQPQSLWWEASNCLSHGMDLIILLGLKMETSQVVTPYFCGWRCSRWRAGSIKIVAVCSSKNTDINLQGFMVWTCIKPQAKQDRIKKFHAILQSILIVLIVPIPTTDNSKQWRKFSLSKIKHSDTEYHKYDYHEKNALCFENFHTCYFATIDGLWKRAPQSSIMIRMEVWQKVVCYSRDNAILKSIHHKWCAWKNFKLK